MQGYTDECCPQKKKKRSNIERYYKYVLDFMKQSITQEGIVAMLGW